MSKYKTNTSIQHQPTPPNLHERLRAKGWSIRDAALYLGVSRQRLYSVFADSNPPRLWGAAIQGIPVCTAKIKAALKLERVSIEKQEKPLSPVFTFAVGDEVIADKYAGIAEEGDRGWIEGIRGSGKSLELLVRMPDGEDWFPIKDFHEFFLTSGITRGS